MDVEITDDLCTADTADDVVITKNEVPALAEIAAGDSVTVPIQCDTTDNPSTNKAHVVATPSGGTSTLMADTMATCPPIPLNPMLGINKVCETELEISGGTVHAKVNATITVENTGDEKLVGVTITDNKISNLSPAGPFMLLPGDTQIVTGSYIPDGVDDTKTMGGDPTDPSEALFKDTASASGTGVISGEDVDSGEVIATCPLCE